MRTKTFLETRTEIKDLYPTMIPTDLQEAINDWFDFRHVGNDEKFPTFFRRTLGRDYVRYTELLRIEPGIRKYDWTVSQYRERKSDLTRQEQRNGSGKEDISENIKVTPTLNEKVTTEYGSTVGITRTDNLKEEIHGNGGTERSLGGTSKTESNGDNEAHNQNKGSVEYAPGIKTTRTVNAENTNEYDNLETEQIYDNLKTSREYATESEQTGNERTRKTNNAAQIAKTNPMSVISKEELGDSASTTAYITYSNANDEGSGAESTSDITGTARIGGIIEKDSETGVYHDNLRKAMPRMVWNNASSMGQSGEDGTARTTQELDNKAHGNDANTTTGGIKETTNGKFGNVSEMTDVVDRVGRDTTTDMRGVDADGKYHDTSEFTRELTDNLKRFTLDTKNNSGTQNLDAVKGGQDVRNTQKSGSQTTTNVTSKDKGDNLSVDGNSVEKEVYTGRDESLASLLAEAKAFIQSSNAFDWLRKQLEPCFMGVYDW